MSRRWARYVLGPAFVAAIAAVSLLSLAPDAVGLTPPLSWLLVPVDTVVLLAVLVGGLSIALLVALARRWREDPDALVTDGPAVEAIVPVYGDADVMHRSVEALVASEYNSLAVTIVVEPDDPASQDRARELAEAHDSVAVLVNEGSPGSKAGALNTAIEAGDDPVIALFDADQEPHKRLVPHAVAALEDAEVARVRSIPDPAGGILESMVYYEYLFLYFLPQKLVSTLLGLEVAGTRSVLIERDVFEKVGTFETGHFAEDLDFTHRCHQAGVAIRELQYYPSLEAPAHTWRDWWGQRRRWMGGQVEVSASHLQDFHLDLDYVASLATLIGTLVAGVLLAMTIPKLVVSGTATPFLVGAGLVGIYAIALATRLADNRSGQLSGVGFGWLLLPLAFTLFGLVIVRVLLGYSLGSESEWYSVAKDA